MEQVNSAVMSVVQAMTAQTDLTKTAGKGGSGDTDDFQKLLDQKAQSAKSDSQTGEQAKAEKTDAAPAAGEDDAPIQEDAQTVAKRLIQAGLIPVDSSSLYAFQEETPVTLEEVPQEEVQAVLQIQAPEETEVPVEAPEHTAQPVQVQPEQIEAQPQRQEQPEQAEQQIQAPGQTVKTEAPAEARTETVREVKREVRTAQERPQEEVSVEKVEVEQAPRQVFQDVKAVPVKVGEAPVLQESQEPDVTGQIQPQLIQAIQAGESQVRIQLNPEALGTVTVEITQSAEGILHVALSARSSETRGLLERHAADLQGLLASRTQDTVQVEVQRQQESQQNQNHSHYDGHNGQDQSGRQQEQQRRQDEKHSQDFIQQLRLGLIPMDGES